MNLFKREKSTQSPNNQGSLAEVTLNAIHDGVIMTDKNGIVEYINPAAATMTNIGAPTNALKLSYDTVIKLESKEGRELSETENPLTNAMKTNQPLESFRGSLIVNKTDKRIPIAVSVLPVNGLSQNRIITFRNITKELEEEGEQTEFISTASHEMRTPVATIDGYLSLSLNPQTATIDERARGYLTAAQAASKHLGKLFQDLLDVTKLDDGRIRPNFTPVEMVGLVKMITDDYLNRAKEAKINFTFGSNEPTSVGGLNRRMEQVVYGFVDTDFMREILDNLIDNAIKYTPAGGSIYINVRGDGDRALINVTDTGIGISADNLSHIFQKFYRADNSDTRTIGGNGLGLYLVKQRVEAMGGKVWAESAFGEGSTFYVSLPRITSNEYEKRMIAVRQAEIANQLQPAPKPVPQPAIPNIPAPQPAPVPQPTPQPAPVPQPTPPTPSQPAPPTPPQPAPPTAPQPQPVQNQINNNNVNGEVK
ncbi:PAS domain-containing protein [Candidatus Saccharibacteria bacterium]|nr:PAS domain-containing protein [Candidatus Saccharibacteria bacterium]